MTNVFELACIVLFESGIKINFDEKVKDDYSIFASPVHITNKENLSNKNIYNKPYMYIITYDLLNFKLSDVAKMLTN